MGSEYRLRYVEEASFLNYSYDITKLWIQATFDGDHITSAQAHLHGLYPPYTNINKLNDWQQKNAVPPMENVLNDQWTKWQAELGSDALPNGFNTFPINVMGADNDYLLRVGNENCPVFEKAVMDHYKEFEQNATT